MISRFWRGPAFFFKNLSIFALMKRMLYLTGFVILCACTSPEPSSDSTDVVPIPEPTECNCADLQLDAKYNWYYLNDRKKPFDGVCTKFAPNGTKIVERHYTTGKVHGPVQEWFPDGTPKRSLEFDMNLQTGEMKEWAQDGELEYHALYNRGKLDSVIYKRVHYINE